MKKLLFSVAFIATSLFTTAQVGIGTTSIDASAVLELDATDKALLLPRVSSTSAVITAVNGMLVYDVSANCIKGFENGAWTQCLGAPTATASEMVLAQIGLEGDTADIVNSVVTVAQINTISPAITGAILANETAYQDYIDANPDSFSSPATQAEVQAMVTAVNASVCPTALTVTILGAPATMTCGGGLIALSTGFTSGDTYAWTADNGAFFDDATAATPNLTLPNLDVNVTVNLTVTKVGCSDVTATPVVIDVDVAPFAPISGTACLDIELTDSVDDPLSRRLLVVDDFTNLPYTVGTSTGATTFSWSWLSNPGGATINSGETTETIDVSFSKTSPAVGTYVLQVVMTGFTCGDLINTFTIKVKDNNCGCPVLISPGVYKTFLCHNLGADTSLDPHVPVVGLQGAYIQWGRRGPNTTGDSSVDWQTAGNTGDFAAAPTASDSNSGVIGVFNYDTAAADYSWRTAAGEKTANDPCPGGYRVPTHDEWVAVNNNNTISRTGPWANTVYTAALHYGPDDSTHLLTLPAAGYRYFGNGALVSRGQSGYYWSSTEYGLDAFYTVFGAGSAVNPGNIFGRTNASSIRCIAE